MAMRKLAENIAYGEDRAAIICLFDKLQGSIALGGAEVGPVLVEGRARHGAADGRYRATVT